MVDEVDRFGLERGERNPADERAEVRVGLERRPEGLGPTRLEQEGGGLK
jgi:hypothetical protein